MVKGDDAGVAKFWAFIDYERYVFRPPTWAQRAYAEMGDIDDEQQSW